MGNPKECSVCSFPVDGDSFCFYCYAPQVEMELINLTPHTINIYGLDNDILISLPSAGVARVEPETVVPGGMVNGIQIVKNTYGEVTGLPGYSTPDKLKQRQMYIVSRMVADACKNRIDLLVPDDLVRNPSGEVIGCRRFSR